jgi:hypothetical protein
MIAEKVDVHYQIFRSISAKVALGKIHDREPVLTVGGFDLNSRGMGWKI